MILDVVQLGDPILREQCSPVENVFDDSVQTFIDNMIDTLIDQKGIGLAAPQVGVSQQIFVVSPNQAFSPPNDSIENGLVVINPTIETLSTTITHEWEGCLSIPGIRGYTPRICDIQINYMNRLGEIRTEQYHEFIARIFLHEFDHLQGTVFLDLIKNTKTDLMTDAVYEYLLNNQEVE